VGRETLAARAARCASADKRIAELESKLNSMRERFVLREDENHSLQTSLNFLADANWFLSSLLTEGDATTKRAMKFSRYIARSELALTISRDSSRRAIARTIVC
jgi:hypothetical protein